jgi:hypothetical protein
MTTETSSVAWEHLNKQVSVTLNMLCNKRGIVGGSVFYAVQPEAI